MPDEPELILKRPFGYVKSDHYKAYTPADIDWFFVQDNLRYLHQKRLNPNMWVGEMT